MIDMARRTSKAFEFHIDRELDTFHAPSSSYLASCDTTMRAISWDLTHAPIFNVTGQVSTLDDISSE